MLQDTEKAGLGISVKGKTATTTQVQSGMIDMGIFIKSVIHGGAASRDGRVKSNDQLISVNGNNYTLFIFYLVSANLHSRFYV